MADYVPAYRKAPPLTIEHFDVRLEELPPMLGYATEHDDMFVLREVKLHVSNHAGHCDLQRKGRD